MVCAELVKYIRQRSVEFSKACTHNLRRVCIVWVTSTYADGRNHKPRILCLGKDTFSQGLHIFDMACAHLEIIFLQQNARSIRFCMHHSWRVWICWATYASSHPRHCKPRTFLFGKETLANRIKYKPIPAHISCDNVDQRKEGSAKPSVLQENDMTQRQAALSRWNLSWTFGSSMAFSNHSRIVNFSFQHRPLPARNTQMTSDVWILHQRKPTRCSMVFGHGVPKYAMDFSHRLIIIRHRLPATLLACNNGKVTSCVFCTHRLFGGNNGQPMLDLASP